MKTSSLPTTPVNNQHNAILLTLLLYMGLMLLALSSANALAYYFDNDPATEIADVQNEFSNSADTVKQLVSTDLITKISLTNDADTSSIKDSKVPKAPKVPKVPKTAEFCKFDELKEEIEANWLVIRKGMFGDADETRDEVSS